MKASEAAIKQVYHLAAPFNRLHSTLFYLRTKRSSSLPITPSSILPLTWQTPFSFSSRYFLLLFHSFLFPLLSRLQSFPFSISLVFSPTLPFYFPPVSTLLSPFSSNLSLFSSLSHCFNLRLYLSPLYPLSVSFSSSLLFNYLCFSPPFSFSSSLLRFLSPSLPFS